MVLTEFSKFHIPAQVLRIPCSLAVNKFVFPCPPLSCGVPFEAALYTSLAGVCPQGGKAQLETGRDLLQMGNVGAQSASHLCTRCHQELERRSIDTCEHSGVKTTLQGLSADFTELLAGAGARGIPPVICSLETGGAELLSCQEFDFWPQLFLPSWSCPSSHRSPRLLKRCTVHCSFLSHPRNA